MKAYGEELNLDVNGWPDDLIKATKYSETIVRGLNHDYGAFLHHPSGMSSRENIEWDSVKWLVEAQWGRRNMEHCE